MHLVGRLPDSLTDSEVADTAAAHGVEVLPLSRYAMVPLTRGALLLGYAGFEPEAIRTGVRRLAAALRHVQERHASLAHRKARRHS